MALRFCVVIFILINVTFSSCTSSPGLSKSRIKACQAVFSPEAYEVSCCEPIDEFVETIEKCYKKVKAHSFTCAVSNCVTAEYKILTHGKIDEKKVRKVAKQLTARNKDSAEMNRLVVKNCLNGQYKQYVGNDPHCDTMKFQICAQVYYLNGCQEFRKHPKSCKKLKKNVNKCRKYIPEYLKIINNN